MNATPPPNRSRISFVASGERTALTLVEVVAAIAIAGGLLATTLVSASRCSKQIRGAQQRLEAVNLADEFLHAWLVGGESPSATEGRIGDGDEYYWRVSGITNASLATVGAHIGRLEVYSAAEPERRLVRVEFVSVSSLTAPLGGR